MNTLRRLIVTPPKVNNHGIKLFTKRRWKPENKHGIKRIRLYHRL